MQNFLIKILFITFFSIVNAFGEIIKSVEVFGNKRISKNTILVLGDISIGKDFNSIEINNSLKKLYDSNFFSDIKFNLNNGKLKLELVENPIIEDIEFTGIKNKSFVDDLKDNIDNIDDQEANTNFGKKFKAAPWGIFKVVITLIFGAITITQLWEIW